MVFLITLKTKVKWSILNPLKKAVYLKSIQDYEWILRTTGMTDMFPVHKAFYTGITGHFVKGEGVMYSRAPKQVLKGQGDTGGVEGRTYCLHQDIFRCTGYL